MFNFSNSIYFTLFEAQNQGYMVERTFENELRFYPVIANSVQFYRGIAKEIGLFLCSFGKDCKVYIHSYIHLDSSLMPLFIIFRRQSKFTCPKNRDIQRYVFLTC